MSDQVIFFYYFHERQICCFNITGIYKMKDNYKINGMGILFLITRKYQVRTSKQNDTHFP